MNEQQLQLLAQVRTYVTEIFRHKVDSHFVFHNLEHTQQVVAAAEELSAYYNLNDEDRLTLLLAAWFHDTGFSSGRAEDHEKESILLATDYLQNKGVENEIIQRVSSCIQATHMPQSPLSLVEKVLCDADLYHLGSQDFKKMNDHLRREQEFYFKTEFSKKEWRQRNIEFLESHQYFTDYAQRMREPKKQEWIRELRRKQGDKEIKHTEAMEISPYSFEADAGEDKGDDSIKGKEGQPNKAAERGIQTVFRTTSHNHIQLSQMADTKANIMISVNAIIISIMFSVLLGRLEYYPHLAIPTLLLAVVSLLAIVFAVLAIRPSVTSGKFTEEDIRQKQTNLLFFGNFHKMELQEYNWAMNEMLKDRDYIYGSMIKDVYFLGIVLAQKYRYLRISYNIFMYGLIIAVLAFGFSTFWAT
jgi:predicted metal-dependent HD superfamily phosphohydrolase